MKELPEWTVCGGCLLRVPVSGDHHCDLIAQLKGSVNRVLIDLQDEFNRNFELQAANFMMFKNNIEIRINSIVENINDICRDVIKMQVDIEDLKIKLKLNEK